MTRVFAWLAVTLLMPPAMILLAAILAVLAPLVAVAGILMIAYGLSDAIVGLWWPRQGVAAPTRPSPLSSTLVPFLRPPRSIRPQPKIH